VYGRGGIKRALLSLSLSLSLSLALAERQRGVPFNDRQSATSKTRSDRCEKNAGNQSGRAGCDIGVAARARAMSDG